MKRAVRFGLALAAGALVPLAAIADPVVLRPPGGAPPALPRLHGVVKSFDGQYLTMKIDAGKTVVIGVPPTARIVHGQMLTLADIHPGDFVGATSITGADGKLRAQGVRIFPPTAHGTGEGLYPLASNAARTVTNGTVDTVTPSPAGGVLKLSFRGAGAPGDPACTGHASPTGCTGAAELIVARGVPVVSTSQGDTSLLLPGAIVSVSSETDASTLLTATAITVERDGKPAAPVLQPAVP
ncbi:MAG TPA: hypothetical protein VHZ29_01070 [Rhizomicrobium sp.]|jgi:hypothetical protein|nr:hypothetical protein [Rhizomicrobium sp.]